MKDSIQFKQHPAFLRFRESVANLQMPNLHSLYQIIPDVIRGNRQTQSANQLRLNELRNEGYEAAARLTMPSDGQLTAQKGSYLSRIKNKRGHRDE